MKRVFRGIVDFIGNAASWPLLFSLVAFGLTLLLYFCAQHIMPFIADDALISLQYVRRLLDGSGLTWTDGPPVEGYSNLLWILLLTLPGYFGADLIDAARVLGFILMALIPLLVLAFRTRDSRSLLLASALVFTLWPLSVPVATWSIGGMEQPLAAFLLVLVLLGLLRRFDTVDIGRSDMLLLVLPLGLLSITRPDGYLFAIISALACLYVIPARSGGSRWKTAFWLLAVPAVFVLAQLIFRLSYYHDWLPNSARVKLPLDAGRLGEGLEYMLKGFTAQLLFWIPAASSFVLLLWTRETRRRGLLLLLFFGAWFLYVTAIGGDIFAAFRHMLPLMLIALMAMVETLRVLFARITPHWRLAAVAGLALLAVVLPPRYQRHQQREYIIRRAMEERWEWDAKALSDVLRSAFAGRRPLIAVTAAGCFPYFTGFPAIDMLGLNDRHIARLSRSGAGDIAHELHDGDYVLSRKPDLIIFNEATALPQHGYKDAFNRDSRFSTDYIPVRFEGEWRSAYTPHAWFRRESPVVGCVISRDTLRIPAYFFLHNGQCIASSDTAGSLITILSAGDTMRYVLPPAWHDPASIQLHGADTDSVAAFIEDGQIVIVAGERDAEIRQVIVLRRGRDG